MKVDVEHTLPKLSAPLRFCASFAALSITFAVSQPALADQALLKTHCAKCHNDKDAEGVVRALDPNVGHWIATTVDNPRGIAASELARRIANETQRPCLVANTADDAIEEARSRPGAQVLVTGSFYLVGPVLERLSP